MCIRAFLVALGTVLFGGVASAATRVEYTIDPARSFVTVLGALRTDSFQPLRPGSSIVSYEGAFYGEIDGDQLRIEGGGARDTAGGGGGSGARPAYELVAETFEGDALLSILSISFNGGSAFHSQPLSISEGTFPGHRVRFFIGDGTMMFQAPGSTPSPIDLHGRGSPNTTQRKGTIANQNGIETLTVPLDLAVPFSLREENDSILTFSGQFVATRPIPEPGAALLAIIGAGSILLGIRVRPSAENTNGVFR